VGSNGFPARKMDGDLKTKAAYMEEGSSTKEKKKEERPDLISARKKKESSNFADCVDQRQGKKAWGGHLHLNLPSSGRGTRAEKKRRRGPWN